MRYYDWNAQIYKELMTNPEDGLIWLIHFDGLTAPFAVDSSVIQEMSQVPLPSEYLREPTQTEWQLRKRDYRLNVISALIQEQVYITSSKARQREIKRIASENGLAPRTISRWYYLWLAKGENGLIPTDRPSRPKNERKSADFENYEWAIKKYYYSPRQMSLKQTYEAMLLARYTDSSGTLLPEHPTLAQFTRYYSKYRSKPSVGDLIRQHGQSDYARNYRPLFGKATDKTKVIGTYEMDATIADIYLVSAQDRTLCVGRPVIYLAVDVVTQLIAGIYVGFEQGESSVVECLRNAATDKVEYCSKFGITVTSEEWPSSGMPGEIITDRGREFFGGRMDELCRTYGITETVLPAYRPELKGTVEKTFDLLQRQYKKALSRKGVVEPDFQQRGAPDYRREAKLTLYEFTQVVIYGVLHLNAHRVIESFIRTPEMAADDVQPNPSAVWCWYADHNLSSITLVDSENLYLPLLPRGEAKFTRKGLHFKGLYYRNAEYDVCCSVAGVKGAPKQTVAYSPDDNSRIWLLEAGEYVPFGLADSSSEFSGVSYAEAEAYKKRERENGRQLRQQAIQSSLNTQKAITGIGSKAAAEQPALLSPKNIVAGDENI